VLGLSFLFEGISWGVALKEFRAQKNSHASWLGAVRASKDPTTFTVLFEDSAAMLGLVFAFLGVFLGERLDNPYLDGAASIAIGVLLGAVAWFLAHESRGLLVGEAVDPVVRRSVCEIADGDPQVRRVVRLLTMHLAPREVLLTLELEFERGAETGAIVDRLYREIRRRHPEIRHIFIEAQSLRPTAAAA